jgi:hypothetical protein
MSTGTKTSSKTSPYKETSSFPMITPTLAMFYQITNNQPSAFIHEGAGEIQDYYWKNTRKIKLSYEEALEATSNLESPIWNDKILLLTFNLYQDFFHIVDKVMGEQFIPTPEVDINFILDIFKKEAEERQKGKITFIHARSGIFKILNSLVNIISNREDSLYLPKCKSKLKNSKKAKDKYDEIYKALPDDIQIHWPDMIPFLKERLISTNISLLNNLYNVGSSSFGWFLNPIGNATPVKDILQYQIKDKKLLNKVDNIIKNIYQKRNKNSFDDQINIGQSILLFSFPENIVDEYVFSTNRGARNNIKYKDLNGFLNKFFGQKLWGKDFNIMYTTQFRIMDLCYYIFGEDDGIEIFEFDQSPLDTKEIEFTLKKHLTLDDFKKLSDSITDLPSVLSKLESWPSDNNIENDFKDLAEPDIPNIPFITPRLNQNVPIQQVQGNIALLTPKLTPNNPNDQMQTKISTPKLASPKSSPKISPKSPPKSSPKISPKSLNLILTNSQI